MSDNQASDTPEQAEFRAQARAWLAANHPGRPPLRLPQGALEVSDPDALKWLSTWQKAAYEAGLVGCDYPTEVGGGGHSNCQTIANQEMFAAKTPYLVNVIGLGMGAPTVFFHAQEEMKQQWLPKLFSGEEIWCQGFSEPGAGSDLANQQTFAERDGDNWIINGHKVWTTLAHFASWMILLCRTSKDDKYNGLSYFVVPIKDAIGRGVTVRPLIKMTGETGFNEVLFDGLVIPDSYRLDEVGAGWKVAMTTLAHERNAGQMITPASGGMPLDEGSGVSTNDPASLARLARNQQRDGKRAADDEALRDEIVRMFIRSEAFRQNRRRTRVPELRDHAQRIPLQSKMIVTELQQDMAELALRIQGLGSTLSFTDDKAPDAGQWGLAYMNTFGITIAGGTNEIQRNILGERVLGLAKTK